jgi:hypothetical protein
MGRSDFVGGERRSGWQAGDRRESCFGRRTADGLMAVNVLLMPDESALERARALNAALRASIASGFAFDDTHEPHVTVVQRYLDVADLDGALGTIEEVVGRADLGDLRLRATGLDGLAFGTPPGTVLAGVAIEPTAVLRALQDSLVQASPDTAGREGLRRLSTRARASPRRARSPSPTSRGTSRRAPLSATSLT